MKQFNFNFDSAGFPMSGKKMDEFIRFAFQGRIPVRRRKRIKWLRRTRTLMRWAEFAVNYGHQDFGKLVIHLQPIESPPPSVYYLDHIK